MDNASERVLFGAPHETGPFRVRRVDYPPHYRQARHSHERGSVTILLSGMIREEARGDEETGSALSVVAKPPGVAHSDEVGPEGARTLQVEIDDGACGDASSDRIGVPDRWRWLHGGGPAAAALLAVARRVHRGEAEAQGSPELQDAVLEALATVGERPGRRGPVPGWVARVREAVRDDPSADRSVAKLADLVGMRPATVSRTFRRHYGLTITEYRRRERLRRAAALVAGDPPCLSSVAFAAGYADHPHMCRDFRELARMSPSSLRRLLAAS